MFMIQLIKNIVMPLLGRCPLHGEVLRNEFVPVVGGAGRVAESKDYSTSNGKFFPYSNRFRRINPCVVSTESTVELRCCQACREAEKAWYKDRNEEIEDLIFFDSEGLRVSIEKRAKSIDAD